MAFTFHWEMRLEKIADEAQKKAAAETYKSLNQAFQRAITAKKWSWPISPSPRDIVDTGSLRQSNTYTVSGNKAVFKWSKEYASIVHNGAISGRRNYPARPWTEAVLHGEYGIKQYDIAGRYKQLFIRYFNEKT